MRGQVQVCAGLVAVIAMLLCAPVARAVAPPRFADGGGISVQSVRQLDDRLFALTLRSPELTAPTNVRVLLPADYDAHPRRRFPVLWLFHGTSGGAQDWTTKGDAEAITAGRELVVVMPDAGVDADGGGYFADWVNGGRFGPPRWETFHVDRLMPWLDAQLRTRATRAGRAIAGLSQGGYGAMSYAARHPDRFLAAAAFSAPLDIAANGAQADPLITPIVTVTETALNGDPPGTIFGDRATNEVNWAAHDPATLASNLRGMRLFVFTGDGRQGPLDAAPNPGGSVIEAGAHTLTVLFKGELDKRSIPVEYHDYGAGTHDWPYWQRDLRDTLPSLMDAFAHPDPAPARVDFTSDAGTFAQWGWDVALRRDVRELATLSGASRSGFTLAGSGAGTVTTPGRYAPGARAVVRLKGEAVDRTDRPVVGSDGRLRVDVPLGPSNTQQQFTAGARTAVHSTVVTIRAPARASCAPPVLRVRVRAPRGARPRSRVVRVRLDRFPAGRRRVTARARFTRDGERVVRRVARTVRVCR